MAHPWAKHIISHAALEDRAAAAKQEAVKSQKYAGELDMWGRSSNCIALVFEYFGRWGHDALQFLNQLSILATDEDGRKNSESSRRTGVAVCL